jgi:hypothetical protein
MLKRHQKLYEFFSFFGLIRSKNAQIAQNATLGRMVFRNKSAFTLRCYLFLTSSSALLLPWAVGCASPGPPRPPSLHLPAVVTDLTAERIGDQVKLHWTTPARTTDGLDIKGPLTAEICRTGPAPTCTTIQHFAVKPGPTEAIETLHEPLTLDPVSPLAYRVQILNSAGHSAGLSPEAYASAGVAPPAVQDLRATPTKSGVVIEWKQQAANAPVELDRVNLTEAPPAKTASKPATKSPLQLDPNQPTEVRLQAGKGQSDPGGTLDRTALRGNTYRYTAQRVRSVQSDGHALEMRSLPSPPITVQLRDIFPPEAPSGLVAVSGGSTPSERSIDLSWEPVSDIDLAGYYVYRQAVTPAGQPQGPSALLNPTPVVGPAYRDLTAAVGQRYAYRVTAVDAAGNESPPSNEIQETLREQ